MVDDFIYSVDVFERSKTVEAVPEPLSAAAIERRLQAAVQDARDRRNAQESPAKVGLLTADERDTWTKVNNYALRI